MVIIVRVVILDRFRLRINLILIVEVCISIGICVYQSDTTEGYEKAWMQSSFEG